MTRRICTAFAAAASVVALAAAPAQASDNDHQALVDNYSTLSGSLINFYAEQSNMSLSNYLEQHQLLVKSGDAGNEDTTEFDELEIPSVSDPDATALLPKDTVDDEGLTSTGFAPLTAADLGSLNALLSASGIGLDISGYKSLNQAAKKITKSASTPDGAVTLASAKWMKQLSTLHAPTLAAPGSPNASMPGIPAEALPFGMLMNKSFTNMINDYPDLVGKAQANGLGSAKAQAAWSKSMSKAYAQQGAELQSLMPNSCMASMMTVAVTGDTAKVPSNCPRACHTAGNYLHFQTGQAFNASTRMSRSGGHQLTAELLGPNGAAWSPYSASTQEKIRAYDGVQEGGPSMCMGASASTKNVMNKSLSTLFAGLKR